MRFFVIFPVLLLYHQLIVGPERGGSVYELHYTNSTWGTLIILYEKLALHYRLKCAWRASRMPRWWVVVRIVPNKMNVAITVNRRNAFYCAHVKLNIKRSVVTAFTKTLVPCRAILTPFK